MNELAGQKLNYVVCHVKFSAVRDVWGRKKEKGKDGGREGEYRGRETAKRGRRKEQETGIEPSQYNSNDSS